MKATGFITCSVCGRETAWPARCECNRAQAEPQEGDLLHMMMEWARTDEGRKKLSDLFRPHFWACAKRVADPQNEAATCRHWCGDIEHCQPIASAPAQAEPQPTRRLYAFAAHDVAGAEPQPDVAALAERCDTYGTRMAVRAYQSLVRQHAISYDMSRMSSRCNLCGVEWARWEVEHHGELCPLADGK